MALRAALCGLLVGAVFAVACGPTRSPCAQIQCSAGKRCDPATGFCVGDGTTDAGTTDAGSTDAGVDGGADAGCGSCPSTSPHCDRSRGRCVECLESSQCACPTPLCAQNTCVAAPDAGPTDGGTGSDRCADAPLLPICTSRTSFTVTTSGRADDSSSRCGLDGGADAFVRFVVPAPGRDFQALATARAGGEPVLSLRRECGEELACDQRPTGTARLFVRALPPGTYTLQVDSYFAQGAGTFDVTVDLTPPTSPANDSCVTAALLPLDGGAVTAQLADAADDLLLACNGAGGSRDVVYQFTLAQPATVLVTAQPVADAGADAGSTDVVLELRGADCQRSGAVRCKDDFIAGQAETVRAANLPAGTYTVVVENYGTGPGGDVQLTAFALPPVGTPNETCATPRLLTLSPTPMTFSVDVWAYADDEFGSCNRVIDGPEATYQFTLGARQRVRVEATPQAGEQAVVYVRSPDCELGPERACAVSASPSGRASLDTELDAGTHFLFIEGYGSAVSGPIDVQISAQAP